MMSTTELVQDLRDLIDLHPHAQVIVDQAIAHLEQQASAAVTDERAAFEEWLAQGHACGCNHSMWKAWQARAALAQPAAPRCPYCNGTGDVHDQTGEWRGSCGCMVVTPAVADGELPQLPEPAFKSYQIDSVMRRDELCTFSDNQMRTYGKECARKAIADQAGQEPVATVVNNWRDDDGNLVKAYVVTLGDFDLEHVPHGTKLYAAPPAPTVPVVDADAKNAAAAPKADEYLRGLIEKLAKYRRCMSYNDSYFGEPAGLLKGVVREMEKYIAHSPVRAAIAAQAKERT